MKKLHGGKLVSRGGKPQRANVAPFNNWEETQGRDR